MLIINIINMNHITITSSSIISFACMVSVWILFFSTTPVLQVQHAQACTTGCAVGYNGPCTGPNSCGEQVAGIINCNGFCVPNTLVVSTDEDFYRVNLGATVRANEDDVCFSLRNPSGPSNGVFVPGKTLPEFYSYTDNNPPGTSGSYIDWKNDAAPVNF